MVRRLVFSWLAVLGLSALLRTDEKLASFADFTPEQRQRIDRFVSKDAAKPFAEMSRQKPGNFAAWLLVNILPAGGSRSDG
jgi:hypothetical protein